MSVIESLQSNIADRAYDRIRADLLFGRLQPGSRLRLDRLAEDYGASVGTLREILSRLASEGLLVSEDQRGFRVMPVSRIDLEEVAELRLLFECHAIPLAFAAGDLEWEARVVAAHHKLASLERHMIAGDRSRAELWKRYDREFHQVLIEPCGSQTLLDLYGDVFDKFLRYQMVGEVFRGETAAAEHRGLLEAALTRDAGRAVEILGHHVNGCVAHLLSVGSLS